MIQKLESANRVDEKSVKTIQLKLNKNNIQTFLNVMKFFQEFN